jgi:hypothetical protein
MEIDVGLFAETKLNNKQPRVMKRLHDIARKTFGAGSYKMEANTTPIASQSPYKPGGTLALAIGDTIGRIQNSGGDALGRWCYFTLRRSAGPPITIIVTYQVVATNPSISGPTTYATQMCSLYHQEARHNPENLRYHHANDLIAFVQECRARGEWIVVSGDLNEVVGSCPDGLTRLCSECGLYDAVAD